MFSFFILVLLAYRNTSNSKFWLTILFFPVCGVFLILITSYLPAGWGDANRAFNFLEKLIGALSNMSDMNLIHLIAIVGGARMVSDFASYTNSIAIGHGIGSNHNLQNIVAGSPLLDTSAGRYVYETIGFSSSSFGAQVAFDMGWIFFIILVLLVLPLRRCSPTAILAWSFGLFQIVIYSSTTMITPWLFLAYPSIDATFKQFRKNKMSA